MFSLLSSVFDILFIVNHLCCSLCDFYHHVLTVWEAYKSGVEPLPVPKLIKQRSNQIYKSYTALLCHFALSTILPDHNSAASHNLFPTATGPAKGLKQFSLCDKTKAEFLLFGIPCFYFNTVENIRTKQYDYDTAVRKLKEYIPRHQKKGEYKKCPGGRGEEGTKDNSNVLKKEGAEKKGSPWYKKHGWRG